MTYRSVMGSLGTLHGFLRTYWLSLGLITALAVLYLVSAVMHDDVGYAVVGLLALVVVYGLTWWRYEPDG